MQLYEKYRPKNLDEFIGNDKAVNVTKRLLQRGIGGSALWISGASGIGKTTLARIIADSIAADLYINEFDCADLLTVATIDKIEKDMSMRGFGKGGKAFIVNESHSLSGKAIRRLLGLLERLPSHIVFVFTTTREGEAKLFDNIDSSPLLSRCIKISLTSQGLSKTFAQHCRDIATSESMNGKPLESYIRLAQRCKNNMRAMLQSIEAGEMLT